MTAGAVVDASVALKWVVDEPGSDQAAALLTEFADQDLSLFAPEHLLGEVGNGLRKRVAQNVLTDSMASAAFDAIVDLELGLVSGADRWRRCLRAALYWSVTTYDALYVLLALDLNVEMITSDARLADSAERYDLPVRLLVH